MNRDYELELDIVREIDLEVDTNVYVGADGATFIPSVSEQGIISWTNDKGLQNPTPRDITGPQGETGETGATGANGTTFTPTVSSSGVISWTNDGGKQNPQSVNIKGADGKNGATFTPTVSTSGVISWTNDGGLPNPDSVNIKGPKGETGATGAGVPSGGATGKVLKKKSDTDYDTEWVDDLVILSYGNSTWADFLAAYQRNAVVYCRASSNANPATGVQGRMAFMAYVSLSGTTPTSVEFQYYRSVTSHSDAQQGDQVFIYKLESNGTWSVTTREAYTKIAAGSGLGSSYSNGTLTLSNGAPVPTGGTTGQVLKKASDTNYDTEWANESGGGGSGLPEGGSTGQILKKKSSAEGDVEWADDGGLPSGGTKGQVIRKNSSTQGDVSWSDEVYEVTITRPSNVYSSDKTFAQIKEAYDNGLEVVAVYNEGQGELRYKLVTVSSARIEFNRYAYNPNINLYQIVTFRIASDDKVTRIASATVDNVSSKLLPSGGTQGQVLKKASNTAYETTWGDVHDLPSGGSSGQVLKKSSASDYATEWADESGGGTLVVNITGSDSAASSDTSPSQIYDAFLAGKQIYAKHGYGVYQLSSCTGLNSYFVKCNLNSDSIGYSQIHVSGNNHAQLSGGSVSTLEHYIFYFSYDNSQDAYTYNGCSEDDPSPFFWENYDSVGNACLVVSYNNASNDPVNETAWVQKQAYEYETIGGDMLPIARVHFANLSVSTMTITDYEMVWNLNDTFMKLNVTKIPLGGSISG